MEYQSSYSSNKLSHAYIIPGSGEEAMSRARELAAAMLCDFPERVPCGKCENCRKVQTGIHPDLSVVRREIENGKQKKNIVVKQIRQLIADAYVLPNEAKKKVYIIEEADTMNPQAQNTLLKILEEPPEFVSFLLLAANPMLLLPTVRSRCATLHGNPVEEKEVTAEESEKARHFLMLVEKATKQPEKLYRWCMENNTMNIQEMTQFMEAVKNEAVSRFSMEAMTLDQRKMMNHVIQLADRCREFLAVNTGPKHIMGYLAVNAVPDRKDNE